MRLAVWLLKRLKEKICLDLMLEMRMEVKTRKPSSRRMLCFLFWGRDDFNRNAKMMMAKMEAMMMMEMVNIFIIN